jgi:hypothetical protein
MPFLEQVPIVMNIYMERSPEDMQRKWVYLCDIRLYYVPEHDLVEKSSVLQILNCLPIGVRFSQPTCRFIKSVEETAIEDFNRGRLYAPEGCNRSFDSEKDTEILKNTEIFVHMTQWKSEAKIKICKTRPPSHQNGGPDQNDDEDWYKEHPKEILIQVQQRGITVEEIQVEFKRWEETTLILTATPGDKAWLAECSAKYPGSFASHAPHGAECDSCAIMSKRYDD